MSAERLVLGIDPGRAGRAAMLRARAGDGAPTLVSIDKLEDGGRHAAAELARIADLIVVEEQTASPQMGVRSAFTLGRGYGFLLGMLEPVALQRKVELLVVRPVDWRGSMGLRTKDEGIEMAKALLGPHRAAAEIRTHDAADAVLLAWWGWKRRLEPTLVSAHETGDGW